MRSIRVVPRRSDLESEIVDPEGEEEGFHVLYDPDDPASVEHARIVLATMLGMDRGPVLFGGASYDSIWSRLRRFLRTSLSASRVAPPCCVIGFTGHSHVTEAP